MTKQVMALVLVVAVVIAFSVPVLAEEAITGKIQALDKVAKKITLNGREYPLGDQALHTQFRTGDEVKATIKGKTVIKLDRVLQ